MSAIVKLTRLYYSLTLSMGIFVISFYINPVSASENLLNIAIGTISMFLILSGGYVLNDVCDIETDKINFPEKPLPQGIITSKKAMAIYRALTISGLAVSILCGINYLIFMSIITLGLWFYSKYSKQLGLMKNILAAALTITLYTASFILIRAFSIQDYYKTLSFPVWLFLITICYQIIKDIRDIKGDMVIRNENSATLYSSRKTQILITLLLLSASAITYIPFVKHYLGWIYLIFTFSSSATIILALRSKNLLTIKLIYAHVVLIGIGSLLDILQNSWNSI